MFPQKIVTSAKIMLVVEKQNKKRDTLGNSKKTLLMLHIVLGV